LSPYLRRYRPYRLTLVLSAGLSVAQSLLLVPVAWLIKVSFDRILAGGSVASLLAPCGAIVLLAAASSLASLVARHLSLRITKRVIADLRMELSSKAYLLAGTFSAAADRSTAHAVIVQDTERLDVGSNALVAVCLPAIITASLFTLVLVALAPPLLLVVLFLAPLSLLANRLLGGRVRRLVAEFRKAFDAFDANTAAMLRRTELTRLRGAESQEIATHAVHVDDLRSASARMAWTATAYTALQGLHITFVSVAILVVGGSAVAMGWMSLGALAAFCFVLAQLGANVRAIWGAVPHVLAGLDALGSITAMLARERQTPVGGDVEHVVRGAISFREVRMGFDKSLFAEVDLDIAACERVAIVGRNGSGKTTLLYLLLGLYEPTGGTILIDGRPLTGLALDHYRRQLGVVLQDSFVFPGTIFANIAYGHPSAELADAVRAAELAGADRFIRDLPDGYLTHVGHDGVALSGGQSQMLAIARALLGAPKILILDEPTNHLDQVAVRALLENLDALPASPTILVATHDEALAAWMGQIYRIGDRRISRVASPTLGALRA